MKELKRLAFHHVEPGELLSLLDKLTKLSRFSGRFLILLAGSTIIATVGLLLNSPAVVIGAMIIAPLMGPLVGLSLASLTAEANLLRSASLTLVAGTLVGVLIAYIVGLLVHSNPFTPEVLGRTSPTLLDLVVACCAGTLGAYCQTDDELSDTVAGVAIAVALVPPLGVVGIGLSVNIPAIWIGAAWLYATNLLGIAIAGVVVFLAMGYRPARHAPIAMAVTGSILCLLMIPLSYSMYELFLENDLSRRIPSVLQKSDKFKDIQLQDIAVRRFVSPMRVVATVYGSESNVTPDMVKQVQDLLVRETGIPIDFRVRIVSSTEIRALVVTPSGKAVAPILLPSSPDILPLMDPKGL